MARPTRRIPEPRAMIVAPQPEAVEAGHAMLAAGGNALDAVLACALTQGVVDPLMCGIGGLGVLQAPRFSATSDVIDIGNRIPRAVQRELEAMGYEVRRTAATFPFAAVHGITMWDQRLEGGADPQRDGLAAGVA